MKLIDKALFLKSTPLFQQTEFDTALAIADRLEMLNLKQAERLFQEGDSAAGLYFVFEGSVRLDNKGQIEELEVGDFFGDESLFNERARSYSCEALCPVTLLLLTKSHFFTLLSEVPSIARELLSLYASQVSLRPRAYPTNDQREGSN